MIEIRRGTPADYRQLMDQVVWSFRINTPAHLRFEFFDPASVRPDAEAMADWRLAFVDGELAGGLVMVPRTMRFGAAEIRYGGIGHVHCFPRFRKAGVFSALLRRAIEDMEAGKIPVSLLGGDRQRYGHYGWEHAGYGRTLSLEPGQMRFDCDAEVPAVTDFREYMGDDEDARRIWAARQSACACPVYTDFGEFKRIFARPNRVVYINERPQDGGFSYAVVANGPRQILEYGGTPAGVERIIRFFVRVGGWNVTLPPVECHGPVEAMLDHYAQNMGVNNGNQMRVNNMALTLQAYLPWLETRLKGISARRSILLEDGEWVSVESHSDGVAVNGGQGGGEALQDKPDLRLTRREAAVLFFGPFLPQKALAAGDGFWRLAFPLPFYWPDLEHV